MITNEKQLDKTVTGLTATYFDSLNKIENKIKENDFILKINGEQASTEQLQDIKIDLSKLTFTGRKKLAKRMDMYQKRRTLKAMNYMFHVLKKMGVITEKVHVTTSLREQQIQAARKVYLKLREDAEVARLAYKELKGDFYKKQN